MTSTRVVSNGLLLMAISLPGAECLDAQGRGLDVTYGVWLRGDDGVAETFTAAYHRRLTGPLSYGLGLTHLKDTQFQDDPLLDRTQTGGELSLGFARDGSGFYGVAAGGLGWRHSDGGIDAQWSVGGGYAVTLFSALSLGLEARYRVEDADVRGFWRPELTDQRGVVLQGRIALNFGSGRGARPTTTERPPTPPLTPPSEPEIEEIARDRGSSADAAELTAEVVRTAIEVMGTPYKWGGTDENGFDCSGLIQFAYREHGIILPRVSRDQARSGTFVEPRVDHLRPGDILGFSVERSRITHVGLYVGNGQFIHSASSGVQLSSLSSADPESRWWQRRLVAARRVVE